MAELADALVLGTSGAYTSCRFDSCPRHKMKQNFVVLVYLAASLLIIAFFAKSLDILLNRLENPTKAEVQNIEVYDTQNGTLRYASGVCSESSDCFVAGCSNEICANEQEVASTCDLKPDHPKDFGYECECYNNKCTWIK